MAWHQTGEKPLSGLFYCRLYASFGMNKVNILTNALCKCANIINSLHIHYLYIHTDINRESRDDKKMKHPVLAAKNGQRSFMCHGS